MKIALFNVHYSPNLGDGLLSHCLARELRRGRPDVSVAVQDLAGRSSFGQGGGRRKLALAIMALLPGFARQALMSALLGREVAKRLRPMWSEALADADVAVLGGGNLMADTDLNFPLKIAGMGAEIRAADAPLGVFGVGVSRNWSRRGRELFVSALSNPEPVHFAARDERSVAILAEYLPGVRARVCRDPAVLACDHFPPRGQREQGGRTLGLNITAPEEISLHATHGGAGQVDLLDWWRELVIKATDQGYHARLFTNGAEQDEVFLSRLEALLGDRSANGTVQRLPRPQDPEALAGMIASFDVIAGHRMHAHIPAFSYRIPSVGLAWDQKLRNFFESVGRGAFVLDVETTSPADALATIKRAHDAGVDHEIWERTLEATRQDVDLLVQALRAALARRARGI